MAKQSDNPLGKTVSYPQIYDSGILHSIDRASGRELEGIDPKKLPFYGADKWTCYEVSWLDQSGKPNVGIAEIVIPCDSPNLVESKSLKLYLNSLNEHSFSSLSELRITIAIDLRKICGSEVVVEIFSIDEYARKGLQTLVGTCLDGMALERTNSQANSPPCLLSDNSDLKDEVLYSHLMKSNCPITGQPDWASVQISYRGRAMNHQRLLAYVMSFRHHQAFHEQCVEKMFMDIKEQCKPDKLTVVACYTRRGGIDINPWRSSEADSPDYGRVSRQ